MDIQKVVDALQDYHRDMVDSDPTVQELRVEVEHLKTELSGSTNHYNGVINDLVKLRDEARAELKSAKDDGWRHYNRVGALEAEIKEARAEAERLNDLVKTLTHRLEVSRNATQRFADELADLRAKNTRPEPSRLEIAAMLMANDRNYDGPTMALKRADALIAAAKEVAK